MSNILDIARPRDMGVAPEGKMFWEQKCFKWSKMTQNTFLTQNKKISKARAGENVLVAPRNKLLFVSRPIF